MKTTTTVKFKVQVKSKHIREGRYLSDSECPIALAIREQVPTARYIKVGKVRVAPTTDGGVCIIQQAFPLPRSAQRFITRFDEFRTNNKPFSFILNVPSNLLK